MAFTLLPNNARDLWRAWELRLFVLLSLLLQMTLVTQGSRRKSIYRYWIQVVVWCTYLTADSVATLALGVLSSRLSNIKEQNGWIDPKSQLSAFWAPFLLVHLGGPDTITAYALEDNELWLRQFARLCVQISLACYVYYMALTGSRLSIMAAAMLVVGFIKYGERTWSLYSASQDRFRDSMLSSPDFGPIYPRIMEQHSLKSAEGYTVKIEEVMEIQAQEDLSLASGQLITREEDHDLINASELFKTFKLLFADLILNLGELGTSRSMFEKMKAENAFRVVEIELGYMYDLLYTKAMLLYNRWGVIRRIVTLSLTCGVLAVFSLEEKSSYSRVDVTITYLLISVAILLEIYSVLLLVSSDWVDAWLLKKPEGSILSLVIKKLQLQFRRQRRWSNTVAQFSLLRFSTKKRLGIFRKCVKLVKLVKKVEKNFNIGYKVLDDNMKDWIFKHLKEKVEDIKNSPPGSSRSAEAKAVSYKASAKLMTLGYHELIWSIDGVDFDQSILIWQIATELSYYEDRKEMHGQTGEAMMYYKMSKLLSQYMLYLLTTHPSMLPTGIGMLQHEDTSIDAQKFFEDKTSITPKEEGGIRPRIFKWVSSCFRKKGEYLHNDKDAYCEKPHKSKRSRDLCEACHLLLQVQTQLPARKARGGKSRSMLFDGCDVASKLKKHPQRSPDSASNREELAEGGASKAKEHGREDLKDKWESISNFWVEALIYAACHGKGYEHAESLSRGGELLNHVWLLMAHFGISEQVRTSEGKCLTKLVLD